MRPLSINWYISLTISSGLLFIWGGLLHVFFKHTLYTPASLPYYFGTVLMYISMFLFIFVLLHLTLVYLTNKTR